MPTLRVGDGGERVVHLQRLLAILEHGPGPVDGRFGPKTLDGLMDFQSTHGLAVDGVCGPLTWHALAKAAGALSPEPAMGSVPLPPLPADAPSVPHGLAGIHAAYGRFSYTSQPDGRIVIDAAWRRAHIVSLMLVGGHRIWCHRAVVNELGALYQEAVDASGYLPERVGCYAARHKMWRADRGLSTHAWGCAIDVDPHLNRYGAVECALRRSEKTARFIEVFEAAGWVYGGRWDSRDNHHLQRVTGY